MKPARRDFLGTVGWGALALSAGACLSALGRFFQPPLLSGASGPVEIGAPETYTSGSLTFVEAARAYLGRDAGGFYAIDATCTHLGCTPRLEQNAFVCPCHGSRFTRDGGVVNGPATRPLARLQVSRAANGHLVIDRSRIVGVNDRLAT